MAKIVVAFRNPETAEKIASLLRESGYEVIRTCTAGSEVKRIFKTIQDGILISDVRLKDGFLDQIVQDLNEHIEILCICKTEYFNSIESARVFKMSLPVNRQLLNAWADMMMQLHYQKLPRRNRSDRPVIEQAKQLIMSEMHLSEEDAHRYLQQLSMKLSLPMAQVAGKILRHENL